MTSVRVIRHKDALKQIDYRLSEACGEKNAKAEHAAVGYRLRHLRGQYGIERIGRGWAEFGHQAGTTLMGEDDFEQVRRIMTGRDPHSDEQLVVPRVVAHPEALLPARVFVDATRSVAAQRGKSVAELLTHPKALERFERLERMLLRKGQTHRAPVQDLEEVAAVGGFALEEVGYAPAELAHARTYADERVENGKAAHDFTLTRDRTNDVARALMPKAMALRTDELWMECVREGARRLEQWSSYGMAGHHGGGKSAHRVESTGWAATITWHRTTRSINDKIGDPHLHAHMLIPHMVFCPGEGGEPGKWRTPAAGGYDLFRYCETIDHYVAALYRRRMTREFGIRYAYNPTVREWQIVGIPPQLIRHFSRRSAQIEDAVGKDASVLDRQRAGRLTAGKKIASTPDEEWAFWRRHALKGKWVPEDVVRAILGYEPPEDGLGPAGIRPPHQPDPGDVAAWVWDPHTGVTASDKAVPLTKIMATVAEACPEGLEGLGELERLTAAATADDQAVALSKVQGGSHLRHNKRFTSKRIVDAERYLVDQATERLHEAAAVVPEHLTQAAIDAFALHAGYSLTAEQEQVVRRLVGAGHGIEALVGKAGSGKTTVMDAARRAWEAAGLRVHGAATAAVAAGRLRAASRISASTIAAAQQRIATGRGLDGVDVLVLEESAMTDDLALAEIVAAARRSGTKLVAIGDPQQLRAVGVGGAFKRVHELVDGLALTENFRQRDPVERAALRIWRTGARATTLGMWAATGHIKATENLSDAYAGMVAAWWQDWSAHTDVHQGIEKTLMLAATNRDVDQLNARARVLARHTGLLQGEDVSFALRGGERLEVAVGDLVRARKNDYRDEEEDVLNGYRGHVVDVDAHRGVQFEWREGKRTHRSWVDPDYIAQGGLCHGYALTIASAQGLTSSTCQVLALGADAHAVYPAMSRVEDRSTLWIPAAEIEPEELQEVLGPARDDAERLDRALAAYDATLTDGDDVMIIDEIDRRRSQEETAPAPVLTAEQARQGQGPTMAEAAPRLEELREQAERAGERAEELHQELIDLNARLEGRRWRTGPLRGRVEQVQGAMEGALAEQDRALQEAQRLLREAVEADLVISRHSTAQQHTVQEQNPSAYRPKTPMAATGPRTPGRPAPAPAHTPKQHRP